MTTAISAKGPVGSEFVGRTKMTGGTGKYTGSQGTLIGLCSKSA